MSLSQAVVVCFWSEIKLSTSVNVLVQACCFPAIPALICDDHLFTSPIVYVMNRLCHCENWNRSLWVLQKDLVGLKAPGIVTRTRTCGVYIWASTGHYLYTPFVGLLFDFSKINDPQSVAPPRSHTQTPRWLCWVPGERTHTAGCCSTS